MMHKKQKVGNNLAIENKNKGPIEVWKKVICKKINNPIPGTTESLNATVAAGIILSNMVCQRLCK